MKDKSTKKMGKSFKNPINPGQKSENFSSDDGAGNSIRPQDITVGANMTNGTDMTVGADILPGASSAPIQSEVPPLEAKVASQFGRYKILQKLGQGGMGAVYKVYDPNLRREVALKLLLGAENQKNVERFLREARTTAQLRHPNIVAVYDIGTEGTQPYFTMDFIQGCSLKELSKNNALPIRQVVEIMIKVGNAIHYAHRKGVIHRDLKPANIMMDQEREPRVMDFGLAKVSNASKNLSQSGMILGTLQYMPPEQAEGRSRYVDERSDVYGLGTILYELLTDIPPFYSDNSINLMFKVLHEEPIMPTQIKVRIPKDLESICLKALEKKKKNRYQSAAEFVDDLARFSRGESVKARPVDLKRRVIRKIEKHKALVLGLTIFLAIFGPLFYFLTEAKTTKPPNASQGKQGIRILNPEQLGQTDRMEVLHSVKEMELEGEIHDSRILQVMINDSVASWDPQNSRFKGKISLPHYGEHPADVRFYYGERGNDGKVRSMFVGRVQRYTLIRQKPTRPIGEKDEFIRLVSPKTIGDEKRMRVSSDVYEVEWEGEILGNEQSQEKEISRISLNGMEIGFDRETLRFNGKVHLYHYGENEIQVEVYGKDKEREERLHTQAWMVLRDTPPIRKVSMAASDLQGTWRYPGGTDCRNPKNWKWRIDMHAYGLCAKGNTAFIAQGIYLSKVDVEEGKEVDFWYPDVGGTGYPMAMNESFYFLAVGKAKCCASKWGSWKSEWEFPEEADFAAPWERAAWGRPLLDEEGKTCYFNLDNGTLYAIDCKIGQKRWSYRANKKQWLHFDPVYHNGIVCIADYHAFYAIDADRGTLRKKLDCPLAPGGTIVGNTAYFGGRDGYLYAIDLIRLKVAQRFPISRAGDPIALAADRGVLYAGSSNANALYSVQGNAIAKILDISETVHKLTISDGTLYVCASRGSVHAYDIETRRPKWKWAIGKAAIHPLLIENGWFYVSEHGGDLYALHLASADRRGEKVIQVESHQTIRRNIKKIWSALEGESMRVKEGNARAFDTSHFRVARWSGNAHLFWDSNPNQKLELAFPVASRGKYRVKAYFSRGIDYGIHQIFVNRAKASWVDLFLDGGTSGEWWFDGYSSMEKPVDLGAFVLEKGENSLGFQCTGKNSQSKGYRFGLDCLVLEKIERR